jgi:hypothetical protein
MIIDLGFERNVTTYFQVLENSVERKDRIGDDTACRNEGQCRTRRDG